MKGGQSIRPTTYRFQTTASNDINTVEYDAWLYAEDNNSDNSIKLDALKKVMLSIMKNELTVAEQSLLNAYYFDNKSMTKIAMDLGVNKSTVSRNISRGTAKIKIYLKYCNMALDIVPIDSDTEL